MNTRPSITNCMTCLKLISKSVVLVKDAKRKWNQASKMICNRIGGICGVYVTSRRSSQLIKRWHFVSAGGDLVEPRRFDVWCGAWQPADRARAFILEILAINPAVF